MIGDRIKEIRGARSREDFAEMAGVHPNTLARWEKGERSPKSDFILFLVEKMGFSPEWVLTGEGPRSFSKESGHTNSHQFECSPEFKLGEPHAPYPQQPTPGHWKISELLSKTAEVLESETVYKDALAANVVAFHQAVTAEQKISRMEQTMLDIEHRLALLEEDNKKYKEENRQLRLQLQGADDDHPGAKAANSD